MQNFAAGRLGYARSDLAIIRESSLANQLFCSYDEMTTKNFVGSVHYSRRMWRIRALVRPNVGTWSVGAVKRFAVRLFLIAEGLSVPADTLRAKPMHPCQLTQNPEHPFAGIRADKVFCTATFSRGV